MEDGGEREIQEAGDVCIRIADTLCCTAETNNLVKQLYSVNKKRVMFLFIYQGIHYVKGKKPASYLCTVRMLNGFFHTF